MILTPTQRKSFCKPPGIPVVDLTDTINIGLDSLSIPGAALYDLSGHYGASLPVASPSFTTSLTGLVPKLNGTSQYITVASTAQSLTTNTAMAWINPTAVATYGVILSATNASGQYNYEMYLSQSPETLTGQFNSPVAGSHSVVSTGTISNGVWSQVVYSYDQSAMRVYINGKFDNSVSFAGASQATGCTYNLGYRNALNNYWFNGLIDNARVWSRVLSATEIQRLWGDPWAGLIFPEESIAMMLGGLRRGSGVRFLPAFPFGGMVAPALGWRAVKAIERNAPIRRRRLLFPWTR